MRDIYDHCISEPEMTLPSVTHISHAKCCIAQGVSSDHKRQHHACMHYHTLPYQSTHLTPPHTNPPTNPPSSPSTPPTPSPKPSPSSSPAPSHPPSPTPTPPPYKKTAPPSSPTPSPSQPPSPRTLYAPSDHTTPAPALRTVRRGSMTMLMRWCGRRASRGRGRVSDALRSGARGARPVRSGRSTIDARACVAILLGGVFGVGRPGRLLFGWLCGGGRGARL